MPGSKLKLSIGVAAVGLTLSSMVYAGAVHRVAQRGREFAVRTLEIAAGDVVEFTNDDEFLHQIFVTAASFKFDSAEQAPGETIEVAFPNSGVYTVRCHIHPKMLLSITAK
jgi:cytochrome c peroxidase